MGGYCKYFGGWKLQTFSRGDDYFGGLSLQKFCSLDAAIVQQDGHFKHATITYLLVHFFKVTKVSKFGLQAWPLLQPTINLSSSYLSIYLSRVAGFYLEVNRWNVQASIWNLLSICLSSYLSTYLSVYIAINLSRVAGFYLEVRRWMVQASIWNLPSTVIYRYKIISNMIIKYFFSKRVRQIFLQ